MTASASPYTEAARPVTVIAAGGTISMAGVAGGPASPELTGEALLAAVPALAGTAGLQVRTLAVIPSPHLTSADALGIAQTACEEAATGRGVVITHGTDTLEEVAFLCDLLYGGDTPIVFTGAMRPATAPGADGPANLADAVALAGSAAATGQGVLVCFANEVHAARGVRKADSVALAAFESPRIGPIGRVAEGRVSIDRPLERRPPIPIAHMDARVEIAVATLGGDGALIDGIVDLGADGLIVVLLGAGHTPPPFIGALERAAARIPVVATVRPKRGSILHDTYDFEGSERELRRTAILPAGALSSAAARIKLMACIGAGFDRAGIAAAFAPDDA